MKCPGCGAELVEGSRYCHGCGGKTSRLGVDYSQMPKRASDVYDVGSSDSAEPETFDEYDEHVANVMWVKFAVLLVGLPLMTFIAIAAGLEQQRTDFLYVGTFLLCLSVLAIVLAVKFYRGTDGRLGKKRWDPPPRFSRRI